MLTYTHAHSHIFVNIQSYCISESLSLELHAGTLQANIISPICDDPTLYVTNEIVLTLNQGKNGWVHYWVQTIISDLIESCVNRG